MSAKSQRAVQFQDRSLLTIILDITPSTWGERDLVRSAKDKALAAKGKSSAGPATMEDLLTATLSLGVAFSCLNRDNVLVVIAATGQDVAIIYPRKGGAMNMESAVEDASELGSKVDLGLLHDYVRLGAAELVNRAAERDEARPPTQDRPTKGAAIASALSLALCSINRFMVAAHGGVSALANTSNLQRREDEGVLALMGGAKQAQAAAAEREELRRAKGMLSPRALVLQASRDRTEDYNALMNCAFAANKGGVVIDGCFIPSGIKDQEKNSPFLEQIVDQTKGVYLAVPSGAAQVGGALTEVLMSVFLPPPSSRSAFNLPALNRVDFRARCFETGESIDIAQICNQCLSIFKNRPKESCPTCGAIVKKTSSKRHKLK